MGIELAITLLDNVFNNTFFFGSGYIVQLMFIFLSMATITRRTDDWKILAFPLCLGWLISGIHINFSIYLISIFAFVIEASSIRSLQNFITGLSSKTGEIVRPVKYNRNKGFSINKKELKRMDMERQAISKHKKAKLFQKKHGLGKGELMEWFSTNKNKSSIDDKMKIAKGEKNKKMEEISPYIGEKKRKQKIISGFGFEEKFLNTLEKMRKRGIPITPVRKRRIRNKLLEDEKNKTKVKKRDFW
ncbi:hypothetical protein GF336_07765 [Candidatus Woesearchaeota archaeon]|nr:hypothetical protein [Candidatus Woesearchaeota archaeon]